MDTIKLSINNQAKEDVSNNNGMRYNDEFRKMIVDLYRSGQSI